MRTANPHKQSKGDANLVVVQLTKPTSSALVGVDLVNGGDASSPPVLKAVRGLALACGLLQPGDLLLSVNEVEVTDNEAAAALIRAAPDRLVLRFRRPPVSEIARMQTTHSESPQPTLILTLILACPHPNPIAHPIAPNPRTLTLTLTLALALEP